MDVSAPSVSSWENGRVRPKPGRIAKLADILGVQTSELLEDVAAPEGFQEVIDRSREQIARAVGIDIEKVRIILEF